MRRLLRLLALPIIAFLVGGNYAGNIVAPSLVYVSAVNCGGIGVGDDVMGNGRSSSPLATVARGVQVVAAGGTVKLNGCPGTPGSYAGATLTSNVTVSAINPGYATLGSSTVGASGVTIGLDGLVLDSGGTGRLLTLSAPASLYTLKLTNLTPLDWGDYGIYAPGATKVAIIATNVAWNSTTTSQVAGMYLPNLVGGSSVTLSGGSCTMSAKASPGFGCIHAVAGDATVTMSADNFDCSITDDASQTSTAIDYCVRTQDIVVQWNATGASASTFTGSAPAGTRQIDLIVVGHQNYGISGSTIRNITWNNNGNGGISCLMGRDSAPPVGRAGATNVTIDNCVPTGTSNALVEGIVFGSTVNGLLKNIDMENPGINCMCGAKDSVNFQAQNVRVRNARSLATVEKGNVNSTWNIDVVFDDPTITAATGFFIETNSDSSHTVTGITNANPAVVTIAAGGNPVTSGDLFHFSSVGGMTQINGQTLAATRIDATHFSVPVDSTGYGAYTSGGNVITPSTGSTWAGSITVNGSTSIIAVSMAGGVGNSASFSGDTYTLTSGSYAANPFQYDAMNYASCNPAWLARWPGVTTCVNF
jgi:hypothetical protein